MAGERPRRGRTPPVATTALLVLDVQESFRARPDDWATVLTKTSHNAFTSTDLDERLRARGVTDVVVCGIRTEQCCETTARVAADLGYAVTFVLDATATMPLPRWGGDGVLDTAEVQARTAAPLQGRFAEVTTVAAVLPNSDLDHAVV